jgi:hypothetical protein
MTALTVGTLTEFTVDRDDQMCSGHMASIPAGATAYVDEDGWVWCADAAAQISVDPAIDPEEN